VCPVSLRIPSSSRSPDHNPHRTIYYLEYPLGRFASLKHRQLARQVGVIITTRRIGRTLVNKINLLVDSLRSIEASRLALVKAESIFLRRTSGCFGTSRGSPRRSSSTTPLARAQRRILRLRRTSGCLGTSRGSSCGSSRRPSSTTLPCAGSSSTTSPPPRVRVPRHVMRLVTRLVAPLVVDYSASRRLVVDYSASRRLVVDYCVSTACPGASARRAARHVARRAARRQLLRLAQARRRLLRLRRASGCLGTSRGSSRCPSSTTLTTSCVWAPRHIARLVT
jgi:hypothetical protein